MRSELLVQAAFRGYFFYPRNRFHRRRRLYSFFFTLKMPPAILTGGDGGEGGVGRDMFELVVYIQCLTIMPLATKSKRSINRDAPVHQHSTNSSKKKIKRKPGENQRIGANRISNIIVKTCQPPKKILLLLLYKSQTLLPLDLTHQFKLIYLSGWKLLPIRRPARYSGRLVGEQDKVIFDWERARRIKQ